MVSVIAHAKRVKCTECSAWNHDYCETRLIFVSLFYIYIYILWLICIIGNTYINWNIQVIHPLLNEIYYRLPETYLIIQINCNIYTYIQNYLFWLTTYNTIPPGSETPHHHCCKNTYLQGKTLCSQIWTYQAVIVGLPEADLDQGHYNTWVLQAEKIAKKQPYLQNRIFCDRIKHDTTRNNLAKWAPKTTTFECIPSSNKQFSYTLHSFHSFLKVDPNTDKIINCKKIVNNLNNTNVITYIKIWSMWCCLWCWCWYRCTRWWLSTLVWCLLVAPIRSSKFYHTKHLCT